MDRWHDISPRARCRQAAKLVFFSESRTAMSCVIFRGLSVWNVGANLSWGFNPEMNVKHKRFKSNVWTWKNYLHRVLKRRVHSWNSLAADACASQSIVCWTSIFFSPWFHRSMVSIDFWKASAFQRTSSHPSSRPASRRAKGGTWEKWVVFFCPCPRD